MNSIDDDDDDDRWMKSKSPQTGNGIWSDLSNLSYSE